MTRAVSVGLAQITGGSDPEANRELSVSAAGELFARGADVVVLPELTVPGYTNDPALLNAGAEPLDGPTTQAWRATATAAGGYVAGGLCERAGEDLFNAAVLVGPEGIVLHYRKLHLFAGEKHVFTPGDLGLPVARTPFGVVGLCVCYDLRFVETARILALEGAELVCVPTAWLPGFDAQRWDQDGYCPQARGAQLQANLDQLFIACASQAGPSGDFDFLGSSLLCDPYGRVLAGPLPGSQDELALTAVDLDEVSDAHDRGSLINPRADRRSDVYGLTIGGSVL
jgi:predicted amidohydrolase